MEDTVKTVLSLMFVAALIFWAAGGDDSKSKSEDGLLWFCVVSQKSDKKPIAAWISKEKPGTYGRKFYAYDDDGETIYEVERDTKAPNDHKELDQRRLDKSKIPEFYEKHKDHWVGELPNLEADPWGEY